MATTQPTGTTRPTTATDPNPPTDGAGSGPTRRVVVYGAMVAAGGAALVACGGDDDKKDDETPGTPQNNDPGSTRSSTQAPQDDSRAPASGKQLGAASEVPVGGGHVYDSEKVVVTQPAAGDYKAFSAVCTHQACLVTSVSDGEIKCPCHGSAFDAATGAVTKGPATKALKAKSVEVVDGQVVLKST